MKFPSINAVKIAVALFIASFAISCQRENSDDVNQDRIYAEYELYYDKNQNKTYASAVFRFGNATGTLLELTSPSSVTFNGDQIPFDQTFSYYRKEYQGLVTGGTFVFTNTEGTSFTNTVSSTRTIDFPTSMDTITASNGYTLAWVGDSIVTDEHVTVWMDGPLQNNSEFFFQYVEGTNSIVMAASQLGNLGTGNTTCTIERVWETTASSVTGAGGKVRCKYKGTNRTVQVVP